MSAILCLPWKEAPIEEWQALLQGLASRDMTTARRAALLRLVWQESFLTREGLMARVEGLLGRGCFGKDSRATFFKDVRAVRRLLAQEGHCLLCGHRPGVQGYYVEGRPPLDERLQRLIAEAVAEVDPRQVAIYQCARLVLGAGLHDRRRGGGLGMGGSSHHPRSGCGHQLAC